MQAHMEEIEAKAARVDELESKMANLEMDKEQMKKQLMAEVKASMATEKRKLLQLRNDDGPKKDNEEGKARMALLGAGSVVVGVGGKGLGLFGK